MSLRFAPCVPWRVLLIRTWARYSEPGPSHPHVGPLFRAWATTPTYGTAGKRAQQAAPIRVSWFTRRTRWSSYHTRMIHHESLGSRTPTALQHSQKRGTRDT